jgi:hypothetical protein
MGRMDNEWAAVEAGMAEEGFHWHRCADCLDPVCHIDDKTFWEDEDEPACDEPRVPFDTKVIPLDLPPSSMICDRCVGRRWSRNAHARKRELRRRRAR